MPSSHRPIVGLVEHALRRDIARNGALIGPGLRHVLVVCPAASIHLHLPRQVILEDSHGHLRLTNVCTLLGTAPGWGVIDIQPKEL